MSHPSEFIPVVAHNPWSEAASKLCRPSLLALIRFRQQSEWLPAMENNYQSKLFSTEE
jgi:hypothetical protein